MLSSYISILGAGSCASSQDVAILSQPVPSSSQIFNCRVREAIFSFRDFGGVSMILFISTRGEPGLVISILLSNISMTGPVPVIDKS